MMHIVRSAAAAAALLAITLSLVPSGAFAADKATWVLIMAGRVIPGSDDSSALTTLGAPINTMPYQYAYDCQVRPGTTPSKTFPIPDAAASGSATSPLLTTFDYVKVPVTLPPTMKADPWNFIYVCRGKVLLNGVDIAVHDGSDISSDTITQSFNQLPHSINFKFDPVKVAQAVGSAKPAAEDCVSYDPANLTTVHSGSIWQLIDGSHAIEAFTKQADVLLALSVARSYHMHCFIGRENTGPDRRQYIMEYFK